LDYPRELLRKGMQKVFSTFFPVAFSAIL